jgi:hypothetical protein
MSAGSGEPLKGDSEGESEAAEGSVDGGQPQEPAAGPIPKEKCSLCGKAGRCAPQA